VIKINGLSNLHKLVSLQKSFVIGAVHNHAAVNLLEVHCFLRCWGISSELKREIEDSLGISGENNVWLFFRDGLKTRKSDEELEKLLTDKVVPFLESISPANYKFSGLVKDSYFGWW